MERRNVVNIETEVDGLIILKGTIVRLFTKDNGKNYEVRPDDFLIDRDVKPATGSVLVSRAGIKNWFQSGTLKLERVSL